MQAPILFFLLASALGVSSRTVSPRDAASGSPTDQLARFDSYPDASCSTSSRRGTARVLRGEQNACRTFSAELGLGAKAIRVTPTAAEDDNNNDEDDDDEETGAADRGWYLDVYLMPFCMGDPVAVDAEGICLPAPAAGTHWMSYRLRFR